MNDKTIRYIGIGVGSLVTLAILYINDDSFSRYGFFASDIKHTMVYYLLEDILREFGARSSTSRTWAYFLWFVCLASGVWFSWKIRFKIASIITKIFTRIHEKA